MLSDDHGRMKSVLDDALDLTELLPLQRSLRLAVVTETYPPEVNGVALSLAKLVHGLISRGHEIQLVRPWQALSSGPLHTDGLQEMLTRGWPIPRYPQLRLGLPAKSALLAAWQKRRPDLVHIATEGPLGWSALQAARKLRLPVSSDYRTNFHAYSLHYGLGWLNRSIAAYLRKFHNQATLTMVPTEALRTQLVALGFERLTVVGRGVDTRHFDPAHRDESLRRHWGAQPGDPVVLHVGRLAPEKNLGLLIRAYEAMRQRHERLRLVVVGDGPSACDVRERCPTAIMLGMQSGIQLAKAYASADIFLFPSCTETYGNVTPEALASGLALVAYDDAAAKELVCHGDNGLLAPLHDADAFVRCACDALYRWQPDGPIRQAARRSMLSRDWHNILEQVENRWWSAIGAAEPARMRGVAGLANQA